VVSDYCSEVQLMLGNDGDQLVVGTGASQLAQSIDGVGKRELLSRHPGYEAAASNLAARLERWSHPREIARRHPGRLAGEHTAEYDSVAIEQRPREGATGVLA